MMASRPFAVFDIDGTLIRWQLYHALADELGESGKLDPEKFAEVKRARTAWKKRKGSSTFDAYEQLLVDLIGRAITGIKVEDFKLACDKVMEEYKDQVYTYTRDLIRDLKGQGYLLFTISASQDIIVGMLADYYGFDDWGGSVYEIADGHFTGEKVVLRGKRKTTLLKELVTRHKATWKGSIGVGDSEGDIPMLEAVEKPIAFNPNELLFKHAVQQGWKVVVERKNMVYELEPGSGKYTLHK
ncbi:MAG: HAD family hydrolase [Candidatus Micrarchaeaceae archaeon]